MFHAAENWMMFRGTSTGCVSNNLYSHSLSSFFSRTNGTTTFQTMSPANITFAQELIAYWVSFVRVGNPNTFKFTRSPTWAAFTSNSARIVLQEDPKGSTTISGSFLEQEPADEKSRCNFVAGLVGQQEN